MREFLNTAELSRRKSADEEKKQQDQSYFVSEYARLQSKLDRALVEEESRAHTLQPLKRSLSEFEEAEQRV